MINKHINFFWGNETMSWMRYMTLYSFRVLNPEWKISLYVADCGKSIDKPWRTHEQQDFFNYRGENYFERLKDLDIDVIECVFEDSWINDIPANHKCDIFRWGYLSTNSGFHADIDILFVKPIDDFYESVADCDTVICHNGSYFSLGFMGSSGENRFFNDLYNRAVESFDIKAYQCVGPDNICGHMKQLGTLRNAKDCWKTIEQKYSELKFYNHKMSLIYPWNSTKVHSIFEKTHRNLPENCIGIHWYAGHPISQKCNNHYNADNYNQYPSTFTYFAGELLNDQR